MAHRWTSGYEFEWTPIMTFMRRRLALLDWFEAHVEPVAFTEDHQQVGIALLSPDLRVIIRQHGLVVSTGLAGGTIGGLLPAIEGIFSVLEPKDVVLKQASSTWTCDLADADYNEERARFAAICAPGTGGLDGMRALDASALVDFDSPEVRLQAEWGVVEPDELLKRLSDPMIGRLQPVASTHRKDFSASRESLRDEAPDVGLLVGMKGIWKVGGAVTTAQQLGEAAQGADAEAEKVVIALYTGFNKGRGERREFAQA